MMSRSSCLAHPGISTLERLWLRRRAFHIQNLMQTFSNQFFFSQTLVNQLQLLIQEEDFFQKKILYFTGLRFSGLILAGDVKLLVNTPLIFSKSCFSWLLLLILGQHQEIEERKKIIEVNIAGFSFVPSQHSEVAVSRKYSETFRAISASCSYLQRKLRPSFISPNSVM